MTASPALAAVGPLALVLQTLTLPIELVAMARSAVPYDPVRQTISDLGSTTCTDIPYPAGPVSVCSPLHEAVGVSGVLAGILMLVAAATVSRGRPASSRAAAVISVALLALTGLSTVLTALVPLDVDLSLHTLVSIPLILLGPLAWAAAVWTWGSPGPGVRTVVVLLALGAVVCGLIVLLTLDGLRLMGLLERVAVWVPVLSLGVLGAVLLGRTTGPDLLGGRGPSDVSGSVSR